MICCFFEALTAGLLQCAVLLTGMIYKVLTLKANGGLILIIILAVIYILCMLCYVGQNFQNKVRTSSFFYEYGINDKIKCSIKSKWCSVTFF